MSDEAKRILLVEPDPQTLEVLVGALVERFCPHLTCVSTAEEALSIESDETHDLVIAELDLEHMPGTRLAENLGAFHRRPMILLADEPSTVEVVRALRAGVQDIFLKPFRVSELIDSVQRSLHVLEVHRRQQDRHQRIRSLVKRMLRERRDLRHRTELICRDLVGAHRKLVHRVMDFDEVRNTRGLPRPE